jgi:hypothetical protein
MWRAYQKMWPLRERLSGAGVGGGGSSPLTRRCVDRATVPEASVPTVNCQLPSSLNLVSANLVSLRKGRQGFAKIDLPRGLCSIFAAKEGDAWDMLCAAATAVQAPFEVHEPMHSPQPTFQGEAMIPHES